MNMTTLEDAFIHELQDALSAEKQIEQALPKMAKVVTDSALREGFERHREETRQQIERLEQCFKVLGRPVRSTSCEGIKGIINEGEKLAKARAAPEVLDAALIGAAQKVEHYEIALYGTICTWADQLGFTQAADLLKQNLSQEKAMDKRLSEVAESLNRQATTTG